MEFEVNFKDNHNSAQLHNYLLQNTDVQPCIIELTDKREHFTLSSRAFIKGGYNFSKMAVMGEMGNF